MIFFKNGRFSAEKLLIYAAIFCLSVMIRTASCKISEIKAVSGDCAKIPEFIIDPGHGGADGGAVAADGRTEKEMNLELSLILKKFFDTFGYNAIMTRTDDSDTDLKEGFYKKEDILNRLKIAEENPNAVYLSIHINLSKSPADKGFQVFYGAVNPKSRTLAESVRSNVQNANICSRIRDAVKSPDRIYIQTHAPNPCLLIECGFLSNREDLALLSDKSYCEKLMFAIFKAVTEDVK